MHRRDFCKSCCFSASAAALSGETGWTAEWDRAVLGAALGVHDSRYDAGERMLRAFVGSEYRYHTAMRDREVHPTRESAEYALLLLEAGDAAATQRAAAILDRILDLQDTDPNSKWYGLWGYYLEEPPSRMAPADWNWADFLGALLLLIAHRHRARLSPALYQRVLAAIAHAAASVRRRNVTMTYTNIAVQGTFVTLAAARLLGDKELGRYAVDRLYRFARTVDETGSFNEYNSPTYIQVTLANLTRMRMLLQGEDYLSLINKIHERAWLHVARHWHPPTRQLAGPMSRCYRTDIGAPLWLQKALNNRIVFAGLDEIRNKRVSAPGEVAILEYQCPEALVPMFLDLAGARQHREVFVAASAPVRPVQGCTWLDREYCLGSANRSDFWIQRRPLLAYWGGAGRPARYVQLRLLKDDYDFASGLFYSVQERNYVLGLASFMSPGGDKHPSLDPIRDGSFMARRLRLRVDLAGARPQDVRINGKRQGSWQGRWPWDSELLVDLGGLLFYFRPRAVRLGNHVAHLELAVEDGIHTISLDWFHSDEPIRVRWSETGPAYAAFTLAVAAPPARLDDLRRQWARAPFSARELPDRTVALTWTTPVGRLGLQAWMLPGPVAEHNRRFLDLLDGKPIPFTRLSEERLAPE